MFSHSFFTLLVRFNVTNIVETLPLIQFSFCTKRDYICWFQKYMYNFFFVRFSNICDNRKLFFSQRSGISVEILTWLALRNRQNDGRGKSSSKKKFSNFFRFIGGGGSYTAVERMLVYFIFVKSNSFLLADCSLHVQILLHNFFLFCLCFSVTFPYFECNVRECINVLFLFC